MYPLVLALTAVLRVVLAIISFCCLVSAIRNFRSARRSALMLAGACLALIAAGIVQLAGTTIAGVAH